MNSGYRNRRGFGWQARILVTLALGAAVVFVGSGLCCQGADTPRSPWSRVDELASGECQLPVFVMVKACLPS